MLVRLVERDMVAAIGREIGFFTLPAAKSVGESGKVYTTDVIPEIFYGVQGKFIINCFALKDESVSLVIHEAEDSFIFLGVYLNNKSANKKKL